MTIFYCSVCLKHYDLVLGAGPPVECKLYICQLSMVQSIVQNTPTPRDMLLVEREKTHGSFEHVSMVSQRIKEAFEAHGYRAKLPVRQCEAVDLIATKLGRIICGNFNEKDHWNDIAGYAKLGSEACE